MSLGRPTAASVQRLRGLEWGRVFEQRRRKYAALGDAEAQRWALAGMMPAFLRADPAFDGDYRQAAVTLRAPLRVAAHRVSHMECGAALA